jgi:hypothetical protein
MIKLTVTLPDELARRLEQIAAARRKSVQQLAVEQLESMVQRDQEPRAGSPAAVLAAMRELPHLSLKDVDEFEAAIAAGRQAVEPRDLFPA